MYFLLVLYGVRGRNEFGMTVGDKAAFQPIQQLQLKQRIDNISTALKGKKTFSLNLLKIKK